MGDNPLVSIIVRTKDRPKLLKRAMQSIAAQTYRPIEVVLVNDGGCDLHLEDLQGILGNISLNYLRIETNIGRAGAGNTGIEGTQGKYVGFLDDDDEYYPEHLTALVSFLEQGAYEVAYTDSLMVYKDYSPQTDELNDSVKREVVFSQDFFYDKLIFENYIPLMCLLFKRDHLVDAGGFDTALELYEDWDLLIRIGKYYPFYHLKQVTADYNQWSIDLQISQRNRDPIFLEQAYLKVISRHIEEITPKRIHGIISEYAHTRQILKDLRNELELQKNYMRSFDAQIDELSSGIREKDAQISACSAELQDKILRIEALNSELEEKDARLSYHISCMAGKDGEIISLQNAIEDRDALIDAMKNTRGWKMLEKYRRVRDRVITPLFGIRRDPGN